EINPPRDLSVSPLFQVGFALQNAPVPDFEFAGLDIAYDEVEDTTAKFDLSLDLYAIEGRLAGAVNFNTTLYEPPTVTALIGHFETLLSAAAEAPSERVSRLPLLPDDERDLAIRGFNDRSLDYEADVLPNELLERWARTTPDAVALTFGGDELTYRELNDRANRLARRLRDLGVGPEVVVGIALDRGFDQIAAVFAVWKAGAGYLPIDLAQPASRVSFMLADTRATVTITTSDLAPAVSAAGVTLVVLDAERDVIDKYPGDDLEPVATPRNLAYVIFTSGSTGTPKGVAVEYRGLANYIAVERSVLEMSSDDRIVQFSSLAFDASILDIGLMLAGGGTLCLGTRESLLPGDDLYETMRTERITVASMPPSAVAALPSSDLPDLRVLMIGGDVLSGELAQQWSRGRRVFNGYGPTEATIGCAWGEVEHHASLTLEAPPIGPPFPNVPIYVLDPMLEPCPVGVPGELYISGVQVARGYAQRPGLTAERFLPDPFAVAPGTRMYRSGDRARFLADGRLEFLGRIDRQVKVRGFRIELGEIEAAMSGHPAVEEAVVVALDDDNDKRLVAYYRGGDATVGELRGFLATMVPDYMIPSVFIKLDSFPTTTAGKIDRGALPAPEAVRPELDSPFTRPRTATEETLAEIWQQVLHVDRVGIFDNFFALGGDSILAIQVIAKANEAGVALTAKQLFQAQTIYDLSLLGAGATFIPPEQGAIVGPVPLTPIQHWFFERDFAERHHFNQTTILDCPADVDPDLLERAVGLLMFQHDVLRARFRRVDDGWSQILEEPGDEVPFVRIDLSDLDDARQDDAFLDEMAKLQAGLDLGSGPVIRAALFEFGPNTTPNLALIVHHLSVDAVSWPILVEDLIDVYGQLQRGIEPRLAPKTTSFKWWAHHLTEYAQSRELRRELDHWLTVPPADGAGLPIDHDTGPNDMASNEAFVVALDEEATHSLVHDVPKAFGTQIMDGLVAAFATAVQRWADLGGLYVDLEGHGREELVEGANLFATVGWFTTISPFFLAVDPDAPPAERIRAAQRKLAAVPNKGIGYGILRYLTDEGKQLAELPSPDIAFNYIGRVDAAYQSSAPFRPTHGMTGPLMAATAPRVHLIETNCSVTHKLFQARWDYSTNLHKRESIEALAAAFNDALREIAFAGRAAVGERR
ncbi:MAG TPA: amino acid adenylation domain-containing protein, partial [Actinomycetota bacterium]|nr:amino acid adenylation domain-containing protein [Actinomycetota bacterium]